MDAIPFGTPHLTSTPRIPNTEEARFVNQSRNARGRKVSFGPNMDAIRKRVEEERRKKEEAKEQDRMARDQLILNGLSQEERKQQMPDLFIEHLTNRLARDKYNEQERVRVHSEDEGNQQDRHSEEELLAVIPDDVLEEMRGLSEQERNVCYTRGKKALEGRFTQDEMRHMTTECTAMGWTLMRGEIQAAQIKDALNQTLPQTMREKVVRHHQSRFHEDPDESAGEHETRGLPGGKIKKPRKSFKQLEL
jgi:hypothetical protein